MDKEDVVYIHTGEYYSAIKNEILESPGGPVVENLSANAGDTGLILGLGRLQMPQAAEPVSHSYGSPHARALQQESHRAEKHHTATKSSPHLLQLERPVCSSEHPLQPKRKKCFNNLAICNNIDDLEGIMLSEISQRKTVIIGPHL